MAAAATVTRRRAQNRASLLPTHATDNEGGAAERVGVAGRGRGPRAGAACAQEQEAGARAQPPHPTHGVAGSPLGSGSVATPATS